MGVGGDGKVGTGQPSEGNGPQGHPGVGEGKVLGGREGGVGHVVGEGQKKEVRGGPWGEDGQELVEGVSGRGIRAGSVSQSHNNQFLL